MSISEARTDYLALILERKRREVERRRRHRGRVASLADAADLGRGERALAALRRPAGGAPRVVAEVKFRSPSAGQIRAKTPGLGPEIAGLYVEGGAAAISVLADGPGFGGSPLEVRRVARAVEVPVLFKEFVLDESQVELARAVGASMVLLLVRALEGRRLEALVRHIREQGMEPVVEAADAEELTRAIDSGATIVGVNARDLRTFRVDLDAARCALDGVPSEYVAVFMSGVRSPEDFARVAGTRADAVLIGEGLMRAPEPGQRLAEILEGT